MVVGTSLWKLTATKISFWNKTSRITAILLISVTVCWVGWKVSAKDRLLFTGRAAIIDVQGSSSAFIPGEKITYRISYMGDGISDFSKLLEQNKKGNKNARSSPSTLAYTVHSSVQGDWVISVLDVSPTGTLLSYQLCSPTVQININSQDAVAEANSVKADLSREIFVLVRPTGKIESLRLSPAIGTLAVSILRTLLGITQVVLPPGIFPLPPQWETQEDDLNGQCLVQYHLASGTKDEHSSLTSKDTGLGLIKAKTRYLPQERQTRLGEFRVKTLIEPKGALSISLERSTGRLLLLQGTESQTTLIADNKVAQSEHRIEMRWLKQEMLSPNALAALQAAAIVPEQVTVPLFVADSTAEREARVYRTQLGAATLESLLAEVTQLEASPGQGQDPTALYLKFKALIYLHPEICPSISPILRTASPTSTPFRFLSGALGTIGHATAQKVLIETIRSRATEKLIVITLIPLLGSVPTPTTEAELFLEQLAFKSSDADSATAALLGLGTMAYHLADIAPARSAKIEEQLVAALNMSSSDDRAREILLSLGNAASLTTVPVIQGFLATQNPVLRVAAVSALQRIDSPKVVDLLIHVLGNDADANVRTEAATALGFRVVDRRLFQAEKIALRRDSAVSVRLTLVRNLWQGRKDFPAALYLLKEVARKDPSPEVRKVAAALVAGASQSSLKRNPTKTTYLYSVGYRWQQPGNIYKSLIL